MKLRKLFRQSLLSLLVLPCLALAQVSVDRAVLEFEANSKPFQFVNVSNSGSLPVRLVAEVSEVLNPGTSEERRVESKDFLVSPRRFSLNEGETKSLRLLVKRPFGEKESVFRIVLTPRIEEPGGIQLGEGERATSLRVVTSAGLLALQRPTSAREELRWTRTGSLVDISNAGNRSIKLLRGQACAEGESNCKKVMGRRLYPGAKISLPLEGEQSLKLRVQANAFSNLEIPSGVPEGSKEAT